jgi:glutamyl-tRNA synthetase
VTTYRERGFVPDALVTFLALFGWSPGTDQEILSRQELIDGFSLEAVHKSAAVFNFRENDPNDWTDPKALWMNGEYIKGMPLGELGAMLSHHLRAAGLWRDEYDSHRRDWYLKTIDLLRARYRTLVDFCGRGRPYFADDFEYEEAAVRKNLADARLKEFLEELTSRFESLGEFTHDAAESALRALADEKGVKAGLLINAARTALTGQAVGPGLFDIITTLGRDRTVNRLRDASLLVNQSTA